MSVDWNDELQHITGLDDLARQVHSEQQPAEHPPVPRDPNKLYNDIADLSILYYKRLEAGGLPSRAAMLLTHDFQNWYLGVISHGVFGHG